MLRAEVVLPSWELHKPEAQKGDAIEGARQEKRASGQRRRRRQKVNKSQAVAHLTPENNARERNRVRTLREAFLSLQAALPSVPPDTKLSKLDVLVLATSYIAHLTQTLDQDGNIGDHVPPGRGPGYLHPMKKWPMRARLYAEAIECEISAGCSSGKEEK